jgi:hypothetical protein
MPGPVLTRRAVLRGGIGATVLAAAGIPAWGYFRRRSGGKLVSDLLASTPFYVAHRGGSGNWPEQSMLAYRSAAECGVDALEISLARSADGVWFGLHDATLDRTSATRGFAAGEHPWAEIQSHLISAQGTGDARQAPQPYLRFEELVDAFAATHTIFVDPKAAAPQYYPELLKIMESGGPRPAERFIAKYYCTGTEWARAARAAGYRTWGFYYGHQVDDGTTPLTGTQAAWDLLGMDVEGSPAAWAAARGYHKPVIGHIIGSRQGARTALERGAQGLMVSAVREVLGA